MREPVRRGIAALFGRSRPGRAGRKQLPVFDSGRPRTPEAMDGAVYEHIKASAARR
ncbi:CopG family transcriptional regulator [Streptomyces sp. NPDC002913]